MNSTPFLTLPPICICRTLARMCTCGFKLYRSIKCDTYWSSCISFELTRLALLTWCSSSSLTWSTVITMGVVGNSPMRCRVELMTVSSRNVDGWADIHADVMRMAVLSMWVLGAGNDIAALSYGNGNGFWTNTPPWRQERIGLLVADPGDFSSSRWY